MIPKHVEFWELGHKLYKSNPSSLGVKFLAGNILDETFIGSGTITYGSTPKEITVDLNSLTSLAPLQGCISFISASCLFHLFPEAEQLEIARQFAALLSPEPGSMIFGIQVGLLEKGARTNKAIGNIFCHSNDSWKQLWDGEVFQKGSVKVEAETIKQSEGEILGPDPEREDDYYLMLWSITRL
jgi:hypothetical protein